MTTDRTCYSCVHHRFCFLRHRLDDEVIRAGANMLNIDGDAAPGRYGDLHKALAATCVQYAFTENQ